jgi:hypothetical protein
MRRDLPRLQMSHQAWARLAGWWVLARAVLRSAIEAAEGSSGPIGAAFPGHGL